MDQRCFSNQRCNLGSLGKIQFLEKCPMSLKCKTKHKLQQQQQNPKGITGGRQRQSKTLQFMMFPHSFPKAIKHLSRNQSKPLRMITIQGRSLGKSSIFSGQTKFYYFIFNICIILNNVLFYLTNLCFVIYGFLLSI